MIPTLVNYMSQYRSDDYSTDTLMHAHEPSFRCARFAMGHVRDNFWRMEHCIYGSYSPGRVSITDHDEMLCEPKALY